MRFATIVAFVLSLVLQVSCPLAVTLIYRRRTGTSWQPFICGAMIYTVFQLFTWLPLSVYADVVISGRLTTEMGAFIWLLGLAFSTSLVEESGRWVGLRYLFPRSDCELSWHNGVMYGLGHGAVETLLLIAGLTFIYFLAYIVLGRLNLGELLVSLSGAPDAAFLQELQAVIDTTWIQPLTVAFERILAIAHQIAWSLLVLQSVAYRQKRWFGFAVLYHASVAVIVPGLARLAGFAVAESVNLLFAGFSFWLILKLRAVASE